ncbi:uncharacterized protein SPSK_10804 [Sporothrix schenckii 1099-18]|uniref:Uncharacterized protein n=1 Tax=Sporothrix schenckii 1099-18 TaxID=1397361 RepID=A0A0F2MF54_SPOSC|nr:uncharacterized protein SPSK_10804 [Sporothrix schenckii 1099-18]KJR87709.1 hypothetical protein SPSK_10804 [Sporothrix schenckii 1099-18]
MQTFTTTAMRHPASLLRYDEKRPNTATAGWGKRETCWRRTREIVNVGSSANKRRLLLGWRWSRGGVQKNPTEGEGGDDEKVEEAMALLHRTFLGASCEFAVAMPLDASNSEEQE